MPTTDFGWPVQRTPVFQVFGTKRKSGIDEDGSSYAEAQEVNISKKYRLRSMIFHLVERAKTMV